METLDLSKRRQLKIEPIDGDGNYEVQLIAAMQRMAEGIAEIQQTLTVLLTVLTMDEPAPPTEPT